MLFWRRVARMQDKGARSKHSTFNVQIKNKELRIKTAATATTALPSGPYVSRFTRLQLSFLFSLKDFGFPIRCFLEFVGSTSLPFFVIPLGIRMAD